MTPDTNLQEILNLTTNAGLLNPPIIVAGQTLRPITLASIALLQQLKSPLIAGKAIDEVDNIILDCCIFIRVQSLSPKEATKLVFGPREALLESAMELAETIAPNQIESVVSSIIDLLRDSTSTRVVVDNETPVDAIKAANNDSSSQGND
jgi:hypothetical protein